MFGKLSGHLQFLVGRLSEKLWIKPLLASIVSVTGILLAKFADRTEFADIVPDITVDSIQSLLSILASSVLVIAALAVASMVSAYASASDTASPRAFPLVVGDDRTQFALSIFVATFIYSIVGLIASKNEYFGPAGRFVLFFLTLLVLALVVITFVTWVDRIARLGRISATIEQVERATAKSMRARRTTPWLGGRPLAAASERGVALYAEDVGFLQHIDMHGLQEAAEDHDLRFEIVALPGSFLTPDRALARCEGLPEPDAERLRAIIRDCFVIDRERTFEDDPRFGLIVLAQIAGRALSPAVNDPGTAIDIIGVLARLFVDWCAPRTADSSSRVVYDRVSVPSLAPDDLMDDAFNTIERDGANNLAVTLRLLRTYEALTRARGTTLRAAAMRHAKRVVALSEREHFLPADRALIERRAAFRLG